MGRNDWGAIVSIAKHYFHLMPTSADRDDLVSAVAEGWSVGLSRLDDSRGVEERTSYLFQCGRGYAANFIRDRVKIRERVSGFEDQEIEPFASAVERHEQSMAAIAMGHRLDEVLAVVGTLPAAERKVVERRYLKGETLVEIAETTGVSRQRVHQLEKRALRKLREVCNPNVEG